MAAPWERKGLRIAKCIAEIIADRTVGVVVIACIHRGNHAVGSVTACSAEGAEGNADRFMDHHAGSKDSNKLAQNGGDIGASGLVHGGPVVNVTRSALLGAGQPDVGVRIVDRFAVGPDQISPGQKSPASQGQSGGQSFFKEMRFMEKASFCALLFIMQSTDVDLTHGHGRQGVCVAIRGDAGAAVFPHGDGGLPKIGF